MLARRWYQCRNPIQKLASAQPQFNRSLLLLLKPVPLQRRPRQPVAHLHPASQPYQPLTGKHRTRTISQQPLTPITILPCGPHDLITLLRFLAGDVAVACYCLFPSPIDANFFAWLRQVLVSTPRAGLSKGVCQTW